MAYTRHNWVCGEVINDTKMNNIEDGIEEALECCDGGPLFIHTSTVNNDEIMDKTWQEIHDALSDGRPTFVLQEEGNTDVYMLPICAAEYGEGVMLNQSYKVFVLSPFNSTPYETETASDYPIQYALT